MEHEEVGAAELEPAAEKGRRSSVGLRLVSLAVHLWLGLVCAVAIVCGLAFAVLTAAVIAAWWIGSMVLALPVLVLFAPFAAPIVGIWRGLESQGNAAALEWRLRELRKGTATVVLLLLALAVSACESQERPEIPTAEAPRLIMHVTVPRVGGEVVVFKLPDGTRCAVFDTYQGGGLDCDWKAAP
jgi:hypothetical protein